jgi:outer membrane protein N
MLPEFGGDSYTKADNFMTGRANGVATYRNTDFYGLVQGLNFALQYQGKNEDASNNQEGTNNGRDTRHENGDGFGISTTYDFGMGISAGAAYTSSDRTNEQVMNTTAGGDKADAWTAGLKYDANNIYLAAMYSETRNMTPYGDNTDAVANKTQNFEVTAQYQFDFGLRPALSTCSQRQRPGNGRAIRIWLNMLTSAQPITSTKTCPPTLITKSTCWMKMTASTKQRHRHG